MVAASAILMGASASILGVSTAIILGAGCFALGYLLAADKEKRGAGGFPLLSRWTKSFVPGTPAAAETEEKVSETKAKQKKTPTLLEIENLAEILEDFKMVLVVRNDLKMGKGKIAAQCSHATLGLYKKLLHRAPKSLNRWENCGQVKVVLKIESEEDLLVLQERAKSLKLPTHVTIDAGRTQIAPNSRTVMAILGPADIVDDVTGGLKLL